MAHALVLSTVGRQKLLQPSDVLVDLSQFLCKRSHCAERPSQLTFALALSMPAEFKQTTDAI
jgi:hypothetical protein